MDWFLYNNGLRHEKVKVNLLKLYSSENNRLFDDFTERLINSFKFA